MILIIDNYDSFTYNLVHLVAQQTEDYKVIRNDECSIDQIKALKPTKILISPGPGKPEDAGVTKQVIAELGPIIPILGVCLGHQAIGEVFGAKVVHAPSLMHGKTSMIYHNNSGVFAGLNNPYEATRYHSLVINQDTLPDCLEVTAWTQNEDGSRDEIMGVRHKELAVEGVQFHPESILTQHGHDLLENFLKG